jgi:stage IV sporulation protein FB
MALDERPYYRDHGYSTSRFAAIFSGSVPLFTAFGIRVRAHSALIFLIACEIILNWTPGYDLPSKLVSMAILFGVILLHEFGHCFAARRVGGSANEILLWPLGGLAYPDVPERPGANFWTTLGGPLANVLICLVAAAAFVLLTGQFVSLNPLRNFIRSDFNWLSAPFFCWWVFKLSYVLLLLNLLPIFPLDGGRLMQSVFWQFIGHHRSMLVSCAIGMAGSVLLGVFGLADHFNLFLVLLAAWLFFACHQMRVHLRETGPMEPWQNEEVDYSSSLQRDSAASAAPGARKRRVSKKALRAARKRARQDAAERQRLDAILAKVSAQGMPSLTWSERRVLRKATEKLRQSEIEMKQILGD